MLNEHYINSMKDVVPSSNYSAQAKIAVEHKNLLTKLFTGFGRKMETTADLWAKKLIKRDYTISEVSKAVDVVMETCEKVPSYSQFVEIARNNSTRPDPNEKREEFELAKMKEYRHKTKLRRDALVGKYSESWLLEKLNTWWDGVYNSDPTQYFSLGTFMPIFLDDFCDAKGDMNIAIEIGFSKK